MSRNAAQIKAEQPLGLQISTLGTPIAKKNMANSCTQALPLRRVWTKIHIYRPFPAALFPLEMLSLHGAPWSSALWWCWSTTVYWPASWSSGRGTPIILTASWCPSSQPSLVWTKRKTLQEKGVAPTWAGIALFCLWPLIVLLPRLLRRGDLSVAGFAHRLPWRGGSCLAFGRWEYLNASSALLSWFSSWPSRFLPTYFQPVSASSSDPRLQAGQQSVGAVSSIPVLLSRANIIQLPRLGSRWQRLVAAYVPS